MVETRRQKKEKKEVSARNKEQERALGAGELDQTIIKVNEPTKVIPEAEARARAKRLSSGGNAGVFKDISSGGITGVTSGENVFLGDIPQEAAGRIQEKGLPQVGSEPRLEEAGAFEEVTPTRTELSSSNIKADIPLLTPIASAISNMISPTGFETPPTEETVREQALRKIRDDSFKKGTSSQVKFGTFIESIPVVGTAVGRYTGGLIQTPSENANSMLEEIKIVGEDASTGQEKVRNGLQDASFGLDDARGMEENIAALEGKLKYLINISPNLQADTDNVNKIESAILKAKKQVGRYKQASSFGYTAELTGTGRIVPTDEQLFFELQRQSK